MTRDDLLHILITMIKARKSAADSFTMNKDMYVESHLCQSQIEALEKMLREQDKMLHKQITQNKICFLPIQIDENGLSILDRLSHIIGEYHVKYQLETKTAP